MDFIKDDLVRMADSPESSQESEERDNGEANFVIPVSTLGLLLESLQRLINLFASNCGCRVGCDGSLVFGSAALADALRRGHGRGCVGLL